MRKGRAISIKRQSDGFESNASHLFVMHTIIVIQDSYA